MQPSIQKNMKKIENIFIQLLDIVYIMCYNILARDRGGQGLKAKSNLNSWQVNYNKWCDK